MKYLGGFQNPPENLALTIELGYSCGSAGADGDFGQGTYNAVVAFQKNNQLDPDGIVGEKTREKLFSSSAVKNTSAILKVGSKGEEVRKVQSRLIERKR